MLNEKLKNHVGHNPESLEILSKMSGDQQEFLANKYDKFNEDIYLRIDREIHKHPKKTPRQVLNEWLNLTHAPYTDREVEFILREYTKRSKKDA